MAARAPPTLGNTEPRYLSSLLGLVVSLQTCQVMSCGRALSTSLVCSPSTL